MLPREIMEMVFIYLIDSKNSNAMVNFMLSSKSNKILAMYLLNLHGYNSVKEFTSFNRKACTYCYKKLRYIEDFFGRTYYVCAMCSRERFTVVSMTKARRFYKLSSKVLSSLPSRIIPNPYRRRTFITLFLEQDILIEYAKTLKIEL